ncbi:MAG: tyrosine-type recombinase/integrase [Pirellulales bacterium]|nr:tyrosine-type recombinase/integrase [Pirellulales bacterium]
MNASSREEAYSLAMKLQTQLESQAMDRTWADVRQRFLAGEANPISRKTRSLYATTLNHVERLLKPRALTDLNAEAISRFAHALRQQGLAPETVRSYLRPLKAMLRWAADIGLIAKRVKFPRLKGKPGSKAKSRAVTTAEFELMLEAARCVDARHFASLVRIAEVMYYGGLRLREAVALSWNANARVAVELAGTHSRLTFRSGAQKNGRAERAPMCPDLAKYLDQVPTDQRSGRVAPLRYSADWAGRKLAAMGREAGIIVNADGKTASAHDLRRSCATRWARRLPAPMLKAMMRHADVATTMDYYVDEQGDEVCKALWAASEDCGLAAQEKGGLPLGGQSGGFFRS